MISNTGASGVVLLLVLCWQVASGLAESPVPVDRNALPLTRTVLQYLATLPQRNEKKLLSGQFISGYPEVTLATVEKIHEETGKWVALLGFDYYAPKSAKLIGFDEHKPARWEVVNPLIKVHWKAGGLATINLHMTNPWTGSNAWDKTSNLVELLTTETPAGRYYHRQLAMIADGLDDLQRAGVVVLFRPFHEVNGSWFWWGAKDLDTFKQLWRAMFHYFTEKRQLHNLIWIYNSRTLLHYPGDDYADMTSFDLYDDDPAKAKETYDELFTVRKPFALGEYGPGKSTKVTAPLNYDYGPFAQRVQASIPNSVYFLCWSGPWGLDANINAKQLLNDPLIVNRDDLQHDLFSKLSRNNGTTNLKTEHFDRDPGWDARNNRIPPKPGLTVKQDFGYSLTHFAGKADGEIGGRVQRSTTPASYADKIAVKTLDDKLTASGSFAVTASQPGAGVFFGFFNSQQPGGSGRPIGSLGLHFDFEGKGGRLAVRLITGGNKSCGTFITPYLPGKFRPTPIKNDGTRYHWTLDYDPQAADGNGRFTFTMRSDTHKTQDYGSLPERSEKEAQARFPNTTTFTVDLTPGYKQEGATFDRFGVLNMMKTGGAATMFFDDLRYNGQTQDFSKDPLWIGTGNRVSFEDREQVGAHDFGFSAKTSHAGGAPGEVGGGLWRTARFGYYADRVGPLNLDQRLEARGKVKLVTAGPDSDMSLGWFNSVASDEELPDTKNFVGIHVGGPTRIGHYFIPVFATAKGTKGKVDKGPVLTPGKVFDWSLVYDPAANGGNGEMRVTLGAESVTLALKPGQKAQGASLDRFGLFTSTAGGQMVKIYLDDLQYTTSRLSRQ